MTFRNQLQESDAQLPNLLPATKLDFEWRFNVEMATSKQISNVVAISQTRAIMQSRVVQLLYVRSLMDKITMLLCMS